MVYACFFPYQKQKPSAVIMFLMLFLDHMPWHPVAANRCGRNVYDKARIENFISIFFFKYKQLDYLPLFFIYIYIKSL